MCSDYFVAATCVLYTVCTAYIFAFLTGYHSWASLCLFLCVSIVVGFQIDSDCDIAYTKIGSGIVALMLLCTCSIHYTISTSS